MVIHLRPVLLLALTLPVIGLTSAWSLTGCSKVETVLQIPLPKQEEQEDSESDGAATSEEHVDQNAKENRSEQTSETTATRTDNASEPLESPGQMSTEEHRAATLGRAEGVLHEVDEILYQAQRDRPDRPAVADNMADSTGGTSDTKSGGQSGHENTGGKTSTDKPTGETEASEVTGGAASESVATGHERPRHDYDEDDDIVTRQVCDLARQEKDPEVRKQLEQKCKQLRNE